MNAASDNSTLIAAISLHGPDATVALEHDSLTVLAPPWPSTAVVGQATEASSSCRHRVDVRTSLESDQPVATGVSCRRGSGWQGCRYNGDADRENEHGPWHPCIPSVCRAHACPAVVVTKLVLRPPPRLRFGEIGELPLPRASESTGTGWTGAARGSIGEEPNGLSIGDRRPLGLAHRAQVAAETPTEQFQVVRHGLRYRTCNRCAYSARRSVGRVSLERPFARLGCTRIGSPGIFG